MAYSATRLTLYALLSAIETDLRELLATQFAHEKDLKTLLGPDLFDKALTRLQKDQDAAAYFSSLAEVLDYLDFADAFQLLNAKKASLLPEAAACLQANTANLQALVPIRNRVAHSRPLNFDDLAIVLDVAQALMSSYAKIWPALARTQENLRTNPTFVLDQVIPEPPEQNTSHNLPVPDFDETGFLGRKTQVDQLISLIHGPYPVITVIGEGGLGKTATALKVAYDLLDAQPPTFDAIVWCTAKAATITAQEIVRIEDAITSSLGMFTAISKELAGPAAGEPIDEIISYLKEFRILLILDNLETVIDKRLNAFLEKLPTGSKVLITSRIGLGEFERRLKLDPMDERESVQLLRALAKGRNLENLAACPAETLKGYCKKMKNNPGYIKWFVSAVQAGSRPEQILDKPGLFLDFCMSNVYTYLRPESKRVLKSMQCVPTPMSQAELAFLNEIPTLTLQSALYQLLATNMVLMASIGGGIASETKYNLSELAREYLVKKIPVPEKDFAYFRNRLRELQSAGDYIRAEKDRFSIFSITTRSKGDAIVAKYLLDALRHVQQNRIQEAQEAVKNARLLAPQYFEVHRVEAWVHVKAGNIPAAEAAYEIALGLEPQSAPLRFWYAGFLTRYGRDNDRSEKQYLEAAKLAPNEPQVKLELARLYLFLHKYAEAEELLKSISKATTANAVLKRKTYDTQLQLFQRGADYDLKQRDPIHALSLLERMVEAFKTSPLDVRDSHLAETLNRALLLANRLVYALLEPDTKEKAAKVARAIEKGLEQLGAPVSGNPRLRGVITRIPEGKRFGFITGEDGRDYFFHFGAFPNLQWSDQHAEGDEVTFQIGQGKENKPCAINCEVYIPI